MPIPPATNHCLAVDSDGCVFDSMQTKQEACFIPRLIAVWGLADHGRTVTERALHLNLYSAHRGENRFRVLLTLLDELRADPAFQNSSVASIDLAPLRNWVTSGSPLSSQSLRAAIAQTNAPLLAQALEWTLAVNLDVASLPPARPFGEAAETLRRTPPGLEIQVVSSANGDALQREWEEADLLSLTHRLHGQEQGSKEEILRAATVRFPPSRVLMVGDAPADHRAAQAAGVLFFPIRAGQEEGDWKHLRHHVLPRFTADEDMGFLLNSALADWESSMRKLPPSSHNRSNCPNENFPN